MPTFHTVTAPLYHTLAAGQTAEYLNITLELYRDPARTDLLAKEEFTADLRYKAKRTNQVTALVKPAAP